MQVNGWSVIGWVSVVSFCIAVTLMVGPMIHSSRNIEEVAFTHYDGTPFSEVEQSPVEDETITQTIVPEECVLTESQLSAVQFSINYAAEHDLSYTLAAIALKESNAGRWKVNIQDPSGGLYHVTLDKVLTHLGWQDTGFNRNRAMQRLVDDNELAAKLAVDELLFWRDYNSGNWLDTWASYNAGTQGKHSKRGKQYAQDIRELINKIQYCQWDSTYNA